MKKYTKVDNFFLDVIKKKLTIYEMACCLVIFRKTSGCNTENADISLSTFRMMIGVKSKQTIITAIKNLQTKKIIEAINTKGKTTNYRFIYQTHYENEYAMWKMSVIRPMGVR